MEKNPTISYVSSVNQSLFSPPTSISRNHSILARTSLHPKSSIPQTTPKPSEDNLASLFYPKQSNRFPIGAETSGELIGWSEQSSPPYPTDVVAINHGDSQRNTESNSMFSIDRSVFQGFQRKQEPRESQEILQKETSQPKDELEALFGNPNQSNQQLASLFTYGNTISTRKEEPVKQQIVLDTFDSDSALTNDEEEKEEEWFFQRQEAPHEGSTESITIKEDDETPISSQKTEDSVKKTTFLTAWKGRKKRLSHHYSSKNDDESSRFLSDSTDSSYSFSVDGSSNSEAAFSSRSRSSNVQSEYCQFFGCHRATNTSGTGEKYRCKQCSFLFCNEVGFFFMNYV